MSLRLLIPDDHPPVQVLPGHDLRLLLVCDHASNRVPLALDRLGLSDDVLSHHVAFDRGARQLTERLSQQLDTPAVLGGYSRLVIDLNRDPSSYNSIPLESDGITVPRNQGLDRAERAARRTELFDRYHRAVADALDHARADGVAPAIVNVHSFTPALADGVHRPWQIGLLWRHDDRLVRPLQEHLRVEPGLAVGDNEPYSGHVHEGYTLPHHAEHPGLAHVLLEVRDDQLATDAGVAEWVDRLSGALDVARGRLVAEH